MAPRVAVVGCASFLGRAVCQRMTRLHWDVTGIASKASLNALAASNPTLDQFYSDAWLRDVSWKPVNVHPSTSAAELKEALAGCDAVVHTFDDDFSHPSRSVLQNIRANFNYGSNNSLNNWRFLNTSHNLAYLCASAHIPNFIMVEDGSRSTLYRRPESSNSDAAGEGDGASRLLTEFHEDILSMSTDMSVSILRPGYMCGPERYLSVPMSVMMMRRAQRQRSPLNEAYRYAEHESESDDVAQTPSNESHVSDSATNRDHNAKLGSGSRTFDTPLHVDTVASCITSIVEDTSVDTSTYRLFNSSDIRQYMDSRSARDQ